ncbi:hypothetical protein N7450_008077 [Penicillium hetheringtonii]|uniref:Uncharacterized protein n=1 Tax=Penicillium hetheringtonii TaxID=911720 RepID=A0AAD6DHA0_9EURO|nr:hypothetical protein N7450_008077 [Penicillium hetheringtonii]
MSTIETHEVLLSYGRTIQTARKSTAERAPRRQPSSKDPAKSTKGKDALSSRETEQTAGKSIKKLAHCPKPSSKPSSGSTKQNSPSSDQRPKQTARKSVHGLRPRRQLLSKSKTGLAKNNLSDQRSAKTDRNLLLLLYKVLNGGPVP